MRRRFNALGTLVMGITLASAPAKAHHGVANFDETRVISLKGTVSAIDFRNPHVHVYFDVQDANGRVEKWESESASPNILTREGWDKNAVIPGDQILITGHRAKNGSNVMLIEKLVLPNGRELNPRVLSGG